MSNPMQSYWLVKQEPEKYSWAQFLKDKKTSWDGVRNYQARNNLRAMKKGDIVLFYRSVTEPAIQGLCQVTRTAYPDPTAEEGDWSAVDLKPLKTLTQPVFLSEIKLHKALSDMALIRQSRLSVMQIKSNEFKIILKLSRTDYNPF